MFIKQLKTFEAFCREECIDELSSTEERVKCEVRNEGGKENSHLWVCIIDFNKMQRKSFFLR